MNPSSKSKSQMPNQVPSPNDKWKRNVRNGLALFSSSPGAGIELAFFTRAGGFSQPPYDGLNLSPDVGDDAEAVQRNRAAVMQALGITSLVTVRQVHSSEVVYVDETTQPDTVQADGLFTDRPGLALGIKVADCLPVYVFGEGAIGLAHAGWRGTRDRIGVNLAQAITDRFGIESGKLSYAFGPCISSGCYEVGPEVTEAFASFPDPREFLAGPTRVGRARLDLRTANRQLLKPVGLTEVAGLDQCPHCHPTDFYSARRDRTTGRNLALILRRAT
jgi:YfiH family protein